MQDDVYGKWSTQIEMAIRKYASGASANDKQDVRQEVLVAFVEAEGKLLELDLHDENKARGFAYSIAKNAVLSYLKPEHEKVSRRSISIDDPDVQRGLTVVEQGGKVINNKFFLELVSVITKGPPNIDMDRALSSLPDDQQTVIRGLYFEGRSQEKVASALGQNRNWVRQRKTAALKELKRLLKN